MITQILKIKNELRRFFSQRHRHPMNSIKAKKSLNKLSDLQDFWIQLPTSIQNLENMGY